MMSRHSDTGVAVSARTARMAAKTYMRRLRQTKIRLAAATTVGDPGVLGGQLVGPVPVAESPMVGQVASRQSSRSVSRVPHTISWPLCKCSTKVLGV
jgi:hypothetical protein